MSRKIFCLMVLSLLLLSSVNFVQSDISVGVRKGDWIEYDVVFAGTPPAGHEVNWARTEIIEIQGTVIDLNITTQFYNGTRYSERITLNLETGQLGDVFIIPANLDESDTFLDSYHGHMTISAIEEKVYAGAKRIVVSASEDQNKYYWDKVTGILVEGISEHSDYSIHSILDKTNLWRPQVVELDSAIVKALFILTATLLVLTLSFFALRRRKKEQTC
jgi:hypothetical protein